MIVQTTLYKKQPILVFKRSPDAKFPDLSIGVRKCKVILEHIDEIQAFYEANKAVLNKPKESTNE